MICSHRGLLPALILAASSWANQARAADIAGLQQMYDGKVLPDASVAALSHLIAQISLLAAQHAGAISEIEINPVLVHPAGQGVTIVDALVVRRN